MQKLKSFNREKSIKRAESREKMLNKIEVLEKPTEINDAMDIRLEPNILSGNDVLNGPGPGEVLRPPASVFPCGF